MLWKEKSKEASSTYLQETRENSTLNGVKGKETWL